ncbi:MAG: FumA C-terminus/TtdB family hydratase beta subunit [Fusobacteria bacterium]|nr:FumA C-terminus/TtdB family hydratase beta subunit [Fusobacteriota bacterium]
MKIQAPISKSMLNEIKSGDFLYISGTIYTARDAAHKKLAELINLNKELPFDLKGAIIYYSGPSPASPGNIVGSIGPTTSYRMDKYTPDLLKQGLSVVIGKGKRSKEVIDSLVEYKAIYCAAYGGAGAYLASKIKSIIPVAFEELGPEAIYKLEVEDFPVIVVNDLWGNDLYESRGKI